MTTFFSTKSSVYFDQSKQDLIHSGSLLGRQVVSGTSSYFEDRYHRVSALYPVANAAHVIKNLLKIAEGVLILIPSLLIEPKTSPLVLKGIGMELGSLVLNCLNTAVSLMTFATRTLSTIFKGYSSNTILDDFPRNENNQNKSVNPLPIEVKERFQQASDSDEKLEEDTLSSLVVG